MYSLFNRLLSIDEIFLKQMYLIRDLLHLICTIT